MIILAGIFILLGIFLLHLCYHFILIPEDEYKSYKKGLPTLKGTLIGENSIVREGQVNGDSRDSTTGELKSKSSYSPEHTKRLFKV